MRVLMVSNTYLPVRNGVTVSLAGWVAGLRELGCSVDVWTIAAHDPGLDGVHATRGIGSMAAGFPYPVSLAAPNELRDRKYDIVHAHHPTVLGPPAARFARTQGAVFAATAHSDYLRYIDDYAPAFSRAALAAGGIGVMRRFFGRADVVFAPSSAIARRVTEWAPAVRVEPCSYPVDTHALVPLPRAEARRALGLAPDTPLAIYAGRVAVEKRLDDLVAEFEAARDLVPGALLAIAGEGPRTEQLRAAVDRLGLGATVRFLGLMSREELGTWFSAADVHVSASPAEVGPLTVVEAAACATPSIGYAVCGFEDRIVHEKTGLLVPMKPGALAGAMVRVLGDRALAERMGRAAAESAAANTPRAAAQSLLGAYEDALAARF